MITTAPAAGTAPTILQADPGRWVFRLPLTILGCAVAASLLVILARVFAGAGRELSPAAQAGARIAPLCALAYAYIRFVYVARTRLAIDDSGISLRQPVLSWTVSWPEISDIREAGPLVPTNRGGIAPAALLCLRQGGRRAIPDIFKVSRAELTARLIHHKSLQGVVDRP